ncbi:MAG TPA: hypothetical protein VGF11_04015 [Acidimicrobiales bacterium]|jgi:hypothetical protein
MLDGTPLDVAIRQVGEVSPPTWFVLPYVPPDVAARAVKGSINVDTGDPEAWAGSGARPGWDAGIPALSGSCGTNGRHLRALGGLLTW